MRKIVILASGSGTNAEAIAHYFADNPAVKIVAILSNRSKAQVHERAKRLGIPSFTFTREDFDDGTVILNKLNELDTSFIVLAGFLAKISNSILEAFPNRIVNIHPSLLPKFGGKGMYGLHVHEAVINAGEKESGITIHYIDDHYDKGDIIAQFRCPVLPEDTPESLAARVHALEYIHYPEEIERILLSSRFFQA